MRIEVLRHTILGTQEEKRVKGRLGFRILDVPSRPSKDTIRRLSKLPAANVADVMGRFGSMDPGIKPVDSRMRVCGPAVTVLARPGDNLMAHKAIELAAPGDVIVVNTGNCTYSAIWGELMTHAAMEVGLGGLVVDGAVRDKTELTEIGWPVFSRTIVATSCDKDGPGEINVPIACGNVVVNPGDVVLGDEDSVVVIPREWADRVADMAEKKAEEETSRIKEIHSGKPFKDDINATLRAKGVI